MELRLLQYFLAVAREQSFSKAAEYLHLTQPTLSRQLKDLEDELGKQLLIRSSKKITLTEDGMLFRKRAEEIVNLVDKTEKEIKLSDDTQISGDIYIGTGETDGIRLIAQVARDLKENYPNIHYHIASDDGQDVQENLDKGLIDFGIFLGDINTDKYNYLTFPIKDVWGILMKNNSKLSSKDYITPEDLYDKPLIISRQISNSSVIRKWFKKDLSELNVFSTYNLIYNASLLADEGLGYVICLDKLINTSGSSNLCFRPLKNMPELEINLVWKKYQILSKASEKFLECLKNTIENYNIEQK